MGEKENPFYFWFMKMESSICINDFCFIYMQTDILITKEILILFAIEALISEKFYQIIFLDFLVNFFDRKSKD
jgi:hypothetical protein